MDKVDWEEIKRIATEELSMFTFSEFRLLTKAILANKQRLDELEKRHDL
tara:strand:- start:1802 stop:1948 length:147 start_codon:yes stop_codon:yes gene_type:complete